MPALFVFLPLALLANVLASQARLRAAEAEERRREADALARQQAALRRVATLVARGADPSDVYPLAVTELARGLDVEHVTLTKFEADDRCVVLAAHDAPGKARLTVGERLSLDGDSVTARVRRHRRAGPDRRLHRCRRVHCRPAARPRTALRGRQPRDGRREAAGRVDHRFGALGSDARRNRSADKRFRRSGGHRDRQRGDPCGAAGFAGAHRRRRRPGPPRHRTRSARRCATAHRVAWARAARVGGVDSRGRRRRAQTGRQPHQRHGRSVHRTTGVVPGHSPGHPVEGRTGPRHQDIGAPLNGSRQARTRASTAGCPNPSKWQPIT